MNNYVTYLLKHAITPPKYSLRLTNKKALPAKYNQLHDKET